MLVYVETNFILELVLRQEESEAAEALLSLARESRITLTLPSFSLAEAYSKIGRRSADRIKLFRDVQAQTHDLSRSLQQQALSSNFSAFAASLLTLNETEVTRLVDVVGQIMEDAKLLEITLPIYRAGRDLVTRAVLKPQDANIYSSILADLSKRSDSIPKLFLGRDTDFSTPTVTKELAQFGCEYLRSFRAGHARILAYLDHGNADGACA